MTLVIDELRGGWLGVPKAYTALDFFGVALGGWVAYLGWRERQSPVGAVSIALGGVMAYIHIQRFFYAPQSRDGLLRLLRALQVTPAEFDVMRAELAAIEASATVAP